MWFKCMFNSFIDIDVVAAILIVLLQIIYFLLKHLNLVPRQLGDDSSLSIKV